MTIKEVEEKTGLARSNIRFYEKEKLIAPCRNAENGYRDYSQQDVEAIKKIAYLRTLGISIEEIRNVAAHVTPLRAVIEQQSRALQGQIAELSRAKAMCQRMLEAEEVDYDRLRVEQYVTQLDAYWDENRSVLKSDCIRFVHVGSGLGMWAAITILCLAVVILSYGKLPPEIPVQWSGGEASSWVHKGFIFAYPVACVLIRYLIRPVVYERLRIDCRCGDLAVEYLANAGCFLVLTIQVFSVLYLLGAVKHIAAALMVPAAVLIGILIAGVCQMRRGSKV